MPHRAVISRGDMGYMGIAFTEGIDGENQRRRYHKLFKRDVLATRYPDSSALRDLGLSNNVHWMLNNLGGSRTTDTTHFRMFSRSYAINQDKLADLLSFPQGYDFSCQHPLESEWESNALDFWQQLTGKTTIDWKGLKATANQNLVIRNIQRQQEEMRFTIDQIRQTQVDFMERTELNMADLIENMNGMHMEVACMRE
ncbi:hypothetical protein KIW84_035309 [Lathyrus oleraceus]|uniref:Uncharacterized protein n=1 Tax=Pisum sativum TaxID=3888 RepID=A0A9D4Y558_PEA|nr:hypothetical protein KIW84_035309 [Pisum sativum]